MGLIQDIASPVSGFLGGVVNSIFAGRQAKKNREFNAAEAEKEYKRNIEMWNMQNAYNDPSAQMARLEKAGLNPNLVYGSGGVEGNSASQPEGYNRAEFVQNEVMPFNTESIAAGLRNFQTSRQIKLQELALQNTIQQGNADLITKQINNERQLQELEAMKFELFKNQDLFGTQKEYAVKQNAEMTERINKLRNDIDLSNKQFQQSEEYLELEKRKSKGELAKIYNEVEMGKYQIKKAELEAIYQQIVTKMAGNNRTLNESGITFIIKSIASGYDPNESILENAQRLWNKYKDLEQSMYTTKPSERQIKWGIK